jgi:hypothetical protein
MINENILGKCFRFRTSCASPRISPLAAQYQCRKFIRVTSLRNCSPINDSQSSSNRHISTSTVRRRLRESGIHGGISAKKPVLKDTNKKRPVWAKNQEQWISDRWKICPLGWWVQIWDFWFQPLCLCETLSRWTDDLRMCDSHREVWRRKCFAGVFFHSFLQRRK